MGSIAIAAGVPALAVLIVSVCVAVLGISIKLYMNVSKTVSAIVESNAKFQSELTKNLANFEKKFTAEIKRLDVNDRGHDELFHAITQSLSDLKKSQAEWNANYKDELDRVHSMFLAQWQEFMKVVSDLQRENNYIIKNNLHKSGGTP